MSISIARKIDKNQSQAAAKQKITTEASSHSNFR
jgi:hypothetical protein